MFSRFITLLSIAAFVAVTAAAPNVCAQDNYCCNQKIDASIPFPGGALGGTLTGTSDHAGLTCTPIPVDGAENPPCEVPIVCCAKKNINGVDTIVCAPIDAGM